MAPQTALWCPARAGLTGPSIECPLLRSLLGVKQTYAYALLECAPRAGQVAVIGLTGCAGLSKDESHAQTTAFAQH